MTVMSCYSPKQMNKYSYNVLNRCEPNGSFYEDLCSGRLNDTRSGPYALGAYDPELISQWANRFKHLARHLPTEQSHFATQLANSWLSKPASLSTSQTKDAARSFFKQACYYEQLYVVRSHAQQNVDDYPWHVGSDFSTYAYNPFMHEVTQFMYSMCTDASFDVCYVDFFKWTIEGTNEASDCFRDLPGCIKERELCLGRCGSEGPNQDIYTLVSKASLHNAHPDYYAYCHSEDLTYDVYLFGPAGTNLRQFAEQMQIRSGLTAFDPSTVTPDVYNDIRNSLDKSNGWRTFQSRNRVSKQHSSATAGQDLQRLFTSSAITQCIAATQAPTQLGLQLVRTWLGRANAVTKSIRATRRRTGFGRYREA